MAERNTKILAVAVNVCRLLLAATFLLSGFTKPVKPYALMVGNPAKQIGWVSKNGHRLQFKNNVAECIKAHL